MSLMNKLLRSKLVTSTRDLEVLQRDPNSPLFSVKTFEALHLYVYLVHYTVMIALSLQFKFVSTRVFFEFVCHKLLALYF